MLYNVSQLLKEPVGASREYQLSEAVDYSSEGWGTIHPEGPVSMLRTPRGILVSADVRVVVPQQCGRCLESYAQPIEAEIEEEFFPVTDVNTGLPLEVPWQDEPYTIDQNHVLDLTEPLRQAIVLATPIQLLCRADCAGLCPECGQNLNIGSCSCRQERVDPRWEALRGLLSQRGQQP